MASFGSNRPMSSSAPGATRSAVLELLVLALPAAEPVVKLSRASLVAQW